MNVYLRILIFLLANFAALGLGSYFTAQGTSSEWYSNLAKAPWTPPGWVFGFSWTFLMVCFAVYLGILTGKVDVKTVVILYSIQWFLNFIWNPVFFKFHAVGLGLIAIVLLASIVYLFLFKYYHILGKWSLLILPYVIWISIATSLNAYILLKN